MPSTARALGKAGEAEAAGSCQTSLRTLAYGLGPFNTTGRPLLCKVGLSLCQHPHSQLASGSGRAQGLSRCSHLLLSLTWQVRTLLFAISAWCFIIVIMNKEALSCISSSY